MISIPKDNRIVVVLIALISALVFIPFIGNCPLFDWDEVNFAECAREMIVSGNYSQVQLNFKPFWEKPPLFILLQAASMQLFGVNEFAARFPNALCSILSMLAMFVVGNKFHSQKFGLIWCLLYSASLLPHFYFKSGIIDPWFNLFIFLSIYQCILFINPDLSNKPLLHSLYAGIFLGLAVLTKGPAALLIAALTIISFLIWNKQFKRLFTLPTLIFVFTTLFVCGGWFLVQWLTGNAKLISEFIDYQIRLFQTGDAGHEGPYAYHFIVLLLGCFPASIVFIAAYSNYKNLNSVQLSFRKFFICLFWIVLLLFSIVKTKIIHYSSLCYFPLTFVATLALVQDFENLKFSKLLRIIYWLVAGLLSLAFICVGLFNLLKPYILQKGWINDEFALQNIKSEVYWSGFEFLPGLILLVASFILYQALVKQSFTLLIKGLLLNLVFIILAILLVVPKIEQYSQRAAIEFYKYKSKEHCYIETHNFKSYAYLFYGNRMPGDYTNPDQVAFIREQLNLMEKEGHSRMSSFATSNLLWMEYGKIDRPAYIVIKANEDSLLSKRREFRKLYTKNGFSFFARYPAPPAK